RNNNKMEVENYLLKKSEDLERTHKQAGFGASGYMKPSQSCTGQAIPSLTCAQSPTSADKRIINIRNAISHNLRLRMKPSQNASLSYTSSTTVCPAIE